MKRKIDSIPIDGMRDTIVVERSNGNNVLKDSRLYCGCCGKILGVLKKELAFPFKAEVLMKALKNKSFTMGIGGSLYHKSCRHSMFTFNHGWKFITLENYLRQVT